MDSLDFPTGRWLDSPAHQAWLLGEGQRLVSFAKASRLPGGFAGLDARGALPGAAMADTLNTTRMIHCFAMAHVQGIPGCLPLVAHGVAELLDGPLRDTRHDGWYIDAREQGERSKTAYLHAFVALAASSAVVAGAAGARPLLDDAIAVIEAHFWREEEGALCESFAEDWSQAEAYRGANSNMHATEAFLALADVTGQTRWLDRALRIAERLIQHHAAAHDFVVVEHFDAHWQPLPDYNRENPADGFRPFGSTPGHAFEWARLLLHLEASRQRAGLQVPAWLCEAARALFAGACRHAWNVDGAPGLVYTLDWHNRPVVRARLHWVHAEACATAAALLRRTGQTDYEQWYRRFWDFIAMHFIDLVHGSWHHELDPQNRPGASIWGGKPDLYHAYQAVLLPRLALAPSLTTALAQANVTKR